MVMLVLVLSAPRSSPLFSQGPSYWPSFHHPCVERLLGEQECQAPHCSMQGNRLLCLCILEALASPLLLCPRRY
ncbi:rCG35879 [Rattus norvegicus]|uniref:RCG35879 n=1 Tax=Rattus norvegicus TaxID=10116 RepID=A6IJF0_RAT|nr:rCG35879 [Rattus norvegicus]